MDDRSRHQALLAIEHELAAGDGDTYRRYLAEEAVVIVPGQVLSRDETIAAMDASSGWDDFSIEGDRVLALGADAALLTYRFRGRRGEDTYEAELSSVYVGGPEGPWKMAFHQQTPVS